MSCLLCWLVLCVCGACETIWCKCAAGYCGPTDRNARSYQHQTASRTRHVQHRSMSFIVMTVPIRGHYKVRSKSCMSFVRGLCVFCCSMFVGTMYLVYGCYVGWSCCVCVSYSVALFFMCVRLVLCMSCGCWVLCGSLFLVCGWYDVVMWVFAFVLMLRCGY